MEISKQPHDCSFCVVCNKKIENDHVCKKCKKPKNGLHECTCCLQKEDDCKCVDCNADTTTQTPHPLKSILKEFGRTSGPSYVKNPNQK